MEYKPQHPNLIRTPTSIRKAVRTARHILEGKTVKDLQHMGINSNFTMFVRKDLKAQGFELPEKTRLQTFSNKLKRPKKPTEKEILAKSIQKRIDSSPIDIEVY